MSDKRMNFIFFFPDEMRADSVSCYGNPTVKMPNYDRLAKEGVKFDKCFVQNPVCSPSRCSVMTGLYVHNFGHRSLWHLLRPYEPSLFRYLKNAGYDIAWFGKNDLYSQAYLDEILGDNEEMRLGDSSHIQGSEGVSGGKNPYSIDDPEYYSFLHSPFKTETGKPVIDDSITKALDFLNSRKQGDKPFMLFLPIVMPHPPYKVFEEFYNMYDPKELIEELKSPDETSGKPSFAELIRKYRRLDKLSPEFFAKIYAVYLGMNSYVDLMLGELLETLDRTGLYKNTTVIASSDHGDWAGNYGLVEKWPNAMDDDLLHVPLIIRTPDNKAGHSVREQVELFDIMPTALELAGIEAEHTHFARSLVPQLNGASGDPLRAVFAEGGYDLHEPVCFENFEGRFAGSGHQSFMQNPAGVYYPKALQQKEYPESVCRTAMIRTSEYKLVKRTSGENELYDLKKDPREMTNVYSDECYRDIRLDLESKLLDWYIKTADTVPKTSDSRGFK
ncbi:MAG: Arylsulfatase [Firmicutes bacterium ADurb.Bin193]|nr:MAG: Arylsulfatase [Firmicutes bacterium ADurb.Bin193]